MAKKKMFGKVDFKGNLKKATSKEATKNDLLGFAIAPLLYTIPASLLKMEGWGGLATSFGLTWLTGALFNLPSVRAMAFGMAGTHLIYGKLSGEFAKADVQLWRLGGTTVTTTGGQAGLFGMRGLSNNLQPGSRTIGLPGGATAQARPMNNRFAELQAQAQANRTNQANIIRNAGFQSGMPLQPAVQEFVNRNATRTPSSVDVNPGEKYVQDYARPVSGFDSGRVLPAPARGGRR